MRSFLMAAAAVASMVFGLSQSASAITMVNFTTSDTSSGLGQTTFGNVTYTSIAGGVSVVVDLTSGYKFVNTGGPGHVSFAFNLNTAAYTITGINPSPFILVSGSVTENPFGPFTGGLDLSGNQNGAPGSVSAPLKFNVLGATITEASFINNTPVVVNGTKQGWVFAADVLNTNTGKTGGVGGSLTTPTSVPEPASMALLGAGLVALAVKLRRRA